MASYNYDENVTDPDDYRGSGGHNTYSYGGSSSSRDDRDRDADDRLDFTDVALKGGISGLSKQKLSNIPGCCGSSCIAARPCACAMVGIAIMAVTLGVGLATMPLDLETNFDSFLETDVESSMRNAAFTNAKDSRNIEVDRRLQESFSSSTVYNTKDFFLAYELKAQGGSQGILSAKTVSMISRFERELLEDGGYRKLCNRTDPLYAGLCSPGMSFMAYVLPTLDIRPGSIVPKSMTLDGNGYDPVPLQTAYLVAQQHGANKLLLPTGYNPKDGSAANVIRSAFRFKFSVGTASDPVAARQSKARAVNQLWEKEFYEKVVIPFLENEDRMKSLKLTMNVWYDGTGFKDFEVKRAVTGDIPLAIGSAVFIHLYMLFHTRSMLLALIGPILAMMSVPLTFIICAVFSGQTTVSFANFLAVFLAVGFGADVMFVYTDIWRESVRYAESPADRLAWTYSRAVKASLATTSTTALSFLCNMASVIRALRQFGFFMGICVMSTWLLITFVYMPLAVVDEIYLSRFRLEFKKDPDDNTPSFKSRMFEFLNIILYKMRWPVIVLSVAFVGLCLGTSIQGVELGSGLPSIFPDEHNMNRGAAIFADNFDSVTDVFGPAFLEPERQAVVCGERDFVTDDLTCSMYWCEARLNAQTTMDKPKAWAGNGTCNCWRKPLTGCPATDLTAPVRLRFVGPAELQNAQLAAEVAEHLLVGAATNGVDHTQFGRAVLMESKKSLPSLLQQVWETGDTALTDFTEARVDLNRTDAESSCGFEEICFCVGSFACRLDETWTRTSDMSLRSYGESWRRLEEEIVEDAGEDEEEENSGAKNRRGLQVVASVSPRKRMKVRVIFGIWAETSVKILGERKAEDTWKFLSSFDLSDPWAQRNTYFFCKDMPKELRVSMTWCFFNDFRDFARETMGRFPVKAIDFSATAKSFIDTSTSATRGTRYMWLEGSTVKAVYTSHEVDFNKGSSNSKVLGMKAKWDTYLAEYNAKAVVGARGTFHVSESWVVVESSSSLLTSTASSLLILCVLAFLCMICFTRSTALSAIVVVATITVIIILLFFIITIMKWQVGLIEVIAFIYFIGYALDYSLHIVYKYGADEAIIREEVPEWIDNPKTQIRVQRAGFALQVMGGATMGSAITTAGSSLFLVFCTLTIFRKLGAMCLTVTIASIFIAIVPLGSVLMVIGPVRPGIFPACCQRFCGPCAALCPSKQASAAKSTPLVGPLVAGQFAAGGRRE